MLLVEVVVHLSLIQMIDADRVTRNAHTRTPTHVVRGGGGGGGGGGL